MTNPELFKLKSPEQLAEQISIVSNILGESIAQPSTYNESLVISVNDLKEKFTVRYQVYLDTLRKERKNTSPQPLLNENLRILNSLDTYITDHMNGDSSSRTLRDRQMTVFEDLRDFLETGGRKGYIKLPTAAGKTVLFTEFVEATALRTLIVVPTKILVEQTLERFQQFAPEVAVGRVYSDAKEFDRKVTITTYDSFVDKVEFGNFVPEVYPLLILDEAHKALSLRRRGIVNLFNRSIKLGFTATPKYAKNKELRELLSSEIHSMNIPEGVELGLLSPLSVYIAETDIDLSNIKIKADGDYDESDLERAININSRNLAAIDVYKQLFPGQKTVMYCVGVKHAEALAKLLNEGGISADFISGYQSRKEQQECLEKFRSGEIKVLCNANILIEGFDESSVVVCFNLRPTLSAVVAEQRGGRALRLDPNNPDKHAIIVDFVGKNSAAGGGVGHNPPITFAQIIESAEILKKVKLVEQEIGSENHAKLYPNIEISGINVITNAEEVMRVTREAEGIIDGGWCSVDALPRRFRLAEEFIVRFLKLFRGGRPEYFEMRHQGDQLREYVSPEAINMLRNYFDSAQRIKRVQENELSASQSNLIPIFRGGQERLKEAAESVLEELAKQDPSLIKVRVAANIPIIAVDRQRFMELMQQRGIQLKDQTLEDIKDTDLSLTVTGLTSFFRSASSRLYPIAQEVSIQLESEHPEYFVSRKSGNLRVRVVTPEGQQAFIEAMGVAGIQLKNKDIQELMNTDLPLTETGLNAVFRGVESKLSSASQEVRARMGIEHPGYFVIRRNGTNLSDVVTAEGRDAFIQAMIAEGVELQDQSIQALKEGDLSLTTLGYESIFIGGSKKIKPIVERVTNELSKLHPEYFAKRKRSSSIINVVTAEGRDAFIQAMIAEGVELQDQSIQALKEGDLNTKGGLTTIFIGERQRLVRIGERVTDYLRSIHPEYFVIRKSGRRYIEVVTLQGRQAFIEAMTVAGVKLKSERL